MLNNDVFQVIIWMLLFGCYYWYNDFDVIVLVVVLVRVKWCMCIHLEIQKNLKYHLGDYLEEKDLFINFCIVD